MDEQEGLLEADIERERGRKQDRETDRQTDRKRSTAERREGEAAQQLQYCLCDCMLPTSQISILKGFNSVA